MQDEKQIINSLETEMSVLGSVMYDPSVFSRIYGVLKTEDFYYPDHRQIYAAMKRLHEAGLDINVKTIENDLQRANVSIGTELKELLDYRVSTQVALSFSAQISEFAGYRTLQREIETLLPSIKQRDRKLMDYSADLNNLVKKISSAGVSAQFVSGDDIVEKYFEMLSTERGEYDLTGIAELDEKIFDFSPKELIVISARPGVGKALPMDTLVLTEKGWVQNGSLMVGDTVIGSNGRPTEVLGVYPQGEREVFVVWFDDGTFVKCDPDHLWTVKFDGSTEWNTHTTKSLANMPHKTVYVPIPDGFSKGSLYTVNDAGVLSMYDYGAKKGVDLAEDFFVSDTRLREAYIQGLMDHHAVDQGLNFRISLDSNMKLVADIFRSVAAIVTEGEGYIDIRFTVKTPIVPFQKHKKVIEYISDYPLVTPGKRITKIVPLGTKEEMQCIEVAAEDHLYTVDGFVLTHNTALMLQSAVHNMQKGAKVGFMSMEMDSSKLTNRLVSHLTGIDSTVLRRLSMGEAASDERIIDALKFLADDNLFIEDKGPFSVDVVANKIRMMVYEHGCNLVYVDYLGLMSGKGNSKNEELTYISRTLKEVAMELNIPLVAASQLNRDTMKNPNARPQLHNLRDSGSIEQDATIVVFLYPDVERMVMGGMTEEDIDKYLETSYQVPIKMELAKQRNGPDNVVMNVIFDKTKGTMTLKNDPY